MNCVLVEPNRIRPDGYVSVTGQAARHLREVMGKKPGELMLAGIIDGPIKPVRIIAVAPDEVVLECPDGSPPPEQTLDLILALPRPKVMKRLWSPLATLGVRTITLTGAERVEPFYFASHAIEETTYRPRLIEGLEQARDTRLPAVRIVPSLEQCRAHVLPGLPGGSVRIIAHPGSTQSLPAILSASGSRPVTLAIGPEGGWTDPEIALFEKAGFLPCSIGSRSLRTDIAVIALIAMVHAMAREPDGTP